MTIKWTQSNIDSAAAEGWAINRSSEGTCGIASVSPSVFPNATAAYRWVRQRELDRVCVKALAFIRQENKR